MLLSRLHYQWYTSRKLTQSGVYTVVYKLLLLLFTCGLNAQCSYMFHSFWMGSLLSSDQNCSGLLDELFPLTKLSVKKTFPNCFLIFMLYILMFYRQRRSLLVLQTSILLSTSRLCLFFFNFTNCLISLVIISIILFSVRF